MSFVFDIDGQPVWSPSLAIGTLYADYVGECSRLLGISSGFGWNANDMALINGAPFLAFVEELYRRSYVQSQNNMFQALTDPVLLPSVVMLQRAGRSVSFAADPLFADRLAVYASSMPD